MTRLAATLASFANDRRNARGISLLLAALVAIVLVLRPAARADGASIADRAALALALIGAIGGIAHGIGHLSERWLLRRAAQPWLAWIAMAAGGAWLAWPEL
jgi:predicted membrane protein